MDFIQELGPSRVSIEGVGALGEPNSEATDVEFQFVQLTDGQLILGLRAATYLPVNAFEVMEGTTIGRGRQRILRAEALLPLGGTTTRNAYLASQALFICRSVLLEDALAHRVHEARAERDQDSPVVLSEVRSILANYFGEARRLAVGNVTIDLQPVDNFVQLKEVFRVVGGIFHTHNVTLSGELKVEEVEELVERFSFSLSFETGTRVNVYEQTTVDATGFERTLLRAPVVRRKARLPGQLGFAIAPQELMELLSSADTLVGARTRISQFIEACNEETFLETRGLNAVSLIDSLLEELDRQVPSSPRLSRGQGDRIRRAAREAAIALIDDIPLGNEERASLAKNVRENIARIEESSFRRKLEFHLGAQRILSTQAERSRIAKPITATRNNLVHGAQYVADTREERFQEYLRLVWLAGALTARSVGYLDGFRDGPPGLLPD